MALPTALATDPTHPVMEALDLAFTTPTTWDIFATAVDDADARSPFAPMPGMRRWMTNRGRHCKLLALWTLPQNSRDDLHEWTEAIRRALVADGGKAPKQRQWDDPAGVASLYR
jgi:hypothetical protein